MKTELFEIKKDLLRKKVIDALKEQGFDINPHVRPSGNNKETYRKIQSKARVEQILIHKKFLRNNLNIAKKYSIDGKDINPEKICLELKLVLPNTTEEVLFKWWNFIWWSIPYQRAYGRQMRFLLWDKTHDAPFGLILLQSPVLRMSVRDKFLEIPKEELDLWVNKSMHAQRVGALPPYNEILGGKMVAISLTCNEIRKEYARKYRNSKTLIKGRIIEPSLLFITTTSAFGRSSIYNRLKYKNEKVAISLGYTKGSGTFHIPENVYLELLEFLLERGVNVSRSYGNGPSRKLKLISLAFNYLDLPKFAYHGIRREFYLFPLVRNLKGVIKKKEKPIFINRPFQEVFKYWKHRYLLPRAKRKEEWKKFKSDEFFNQVEEFLGES